MTDSLSGGKIGYVHVRGMNSTSFREFYSEVLGRNWDKKALIVDTRFNGGGWLHDDLATMLGGKKYVHGLCTMCKNYALYTRMNASISEQPVHIFLKKYIST